MAHFAVLEIEGGDSGTSAFGDDRAAAYDFGRFHARATSLVAAESVIESETHRMIRRFPDRLLRFWTVGFITTSAGGAHCDLRGILSGLKCYMAAGRLAQWAAEHIHDAGILGIHAKAAIH